MLHRVEDITEALGARGCRPRRSRARNVSLLVAIGVNHEGYREILGICEGAKEDKAGWSSFLKHLKERGLTVSPASS